MCRRGLKGPFFVRAFNSSRSGNHEIYVMQADGTGIRARTAGSSRAIRSGRPIGSGASWCGSKADKRRYLTDAQGRFSQRLTSRPGLAFDPSWSPDGRLILFTGRQRARRAPKPTPLDGSVADEEFPFN